MRDDLRLDAQAVLHRVAERVGLIRIGVDRPVQSAVGRQRPEHVPDRAVEIRPPEVAERADGYGAGGIAAWQREAAQRHRLRLERRVVKIPAAAETEEV